MKNPADDPGDKAVRPSRGSGVGLVVAPQHDAAWEGAAVLEGGGNAADALVTAALVQGIADPHRCGIGGFGCATVYWRRGRQALAYGFHGRAGEKATATLWERDLEQPAPDGFGYVIRGKANDVGYRSITTPGMTAGLAAIHGRFGSRPWKDLVRRAAEAARRGFLVGPGLAEFWIRPGLHGRVSTRDRLGHTAEGRRLWFDDAGETFRSGQVVRLHDLARTYDRLADEGPESFYRGPLAREIARDLEAHEALVTERDLAGYTACQEPALEGRYRGLRILTSPLPGGGTSLLQALALLEGLDPTTLDHNGPEYVERLGGIFRAVWRDRLDHHGDPAFGAESSEVLLSRPYLDELSKRAGSAPRETLPVDSPDTTQLTIVDADLNCISFSHSLGYGSGVFTPGLGFMYNNCMSGFDPRPGRAGSIAPGKARSTAIAETIVLSGDEPFLVLGSPGAARITAALAQVIVNVIDFGMSVAEAVVHPRFDAYGEKTIFLESRFPLAVEAELGRRGWEITRSPKPFGMVGRVYAAEIEPGGRLVGGVDPGEPGAAVRSQR